MKLVLIGLIGLALAFGAGFTLFLLVGPFLAGRFHATPDRPVEHRHRVPPAKALP